MSTAGPADFAQLQLLDGIVQGALVEELGPELAAGLLPKPGTREYAMALRARRARMKGLVFAFLVGRGADGATDQEMQLGLGLHANSQAPRRVDLVREGVVVNTGKRRKTSSGHTAIVWAVRPDEKPSRGP